MQNEILDAPQEGKSLKYQRSSYVIFLLALCFFVLMMCMVIFDNLLDLETFVILIGFFSFAIVGLSSWGCVLGIQSYYKKEPLSYKKRAGMFGNAVILAVMIILFVIIIIDSYHPFL